jgi:hypothetical protein
MTQKLCQKPERNTARAPKFDRWKIAAGPDYTAAKANPLTGRKAAAAVPD